MTFSILPQSLRIDERRLVNCKKKNGLNATEVKKVSVLLGINFLKKHYSIFIPLEE